MQRLLCSTTCYLAYYKGTIAVLCRDWRATRCPRWSALMYMRVVGRRTLAATVLPSGGCCISAVNVHSRALCMAVSADLYMA